MTLQHSRTKAGLTQEKLAQRLGLRRITVARYENGTRRPSPKIATRIGEVLSLSKDELWAMFYEKESPHANVPDP